MIAKMKKFLKKIISISLLFAISLQFVSYAKRKNPYEGEVDTPVAEAKTNYSEGTIYSENPYHEYNPLNPVKPGVNVDEYKSVDNYIVDLNTVESRIKYFSPTYTNIKSSAETSYWMSFYARGGNNVLLYDKDKYLEDAKDMLNNAKSALDAAVKEKNSLKPTDERYKELEDLIDNTLRPTYNGILSSYNVSKLTIDRTRSALRLSRALYNIGNVDNNNQIAFARRTVTKAIKSLVMTYLQLSVYAEVLDKQSKLYYDMYMLKLKNQTLGLATAVDVEDSINAYETAKNDSKKMKTNLRNVKEQLALNLGYKISDIDKLEFIEPEVDMNYILSINFEDDKTRAYTSNSSYKSINLNDKDKKLPQSTGEDLLHKREEYTSKKIINEFEHIYSNLQAKMLSYEGSLYLAEMVNINEQANLRKFQNNLISELEYKGLEIQNLANTLQVKTAKYDLINATNDYYYGALGHITIS